MPVIPKPFVIPNPAAAESLPSSEEAFGLPITASAVVMIFSLHIGYNCVTMEKMRTR